MVPSFTIPGGWGRSAPKPSVISSTEVIAIEDDTPPPKEPIAGEPEVAGGEELPEKTTTGPSQNQK